MDEKLDIFEIALKNDLEIPLNSSEKEMLTHMDEDVKQEIYDLINNIAFLDELETITKNIIRKSADLSEEEQKYIRMKCQKRICNLTHPSTTSKIPNVISSK